MGVSIKVLAICHQIGSARAVAPAIRELTEQAVQVVTIAGEHAAAGFRQQGTPFRVPVEYGEGASFDLAGAILDREHPDVVLSGTSTGDTLERALVWQAKQVRIPTVAVLDHWSNYAARFAGSLGPLHYWPDRLAVMDEVARTDLIQLGFPARAVVVTGPPALDSLPALFRSADRDVCRSELAIGADERLLVFASEPQARDDGDALGYTEIDALRTLLDGLAEPRFRSWRVWVKPHPTETRDGLQAEMERHAVRVEFAPPSEPRHLMIAADAVSGMTSMFLIEAALLGCPVFSIQPGIRVPDAFIGKRLGLVSSAYSVQELRAALIELEQPVDRPARAERCWGHCHLDGHAAERVAELVNSTRKESIR